MKLICPICKQELKKENRSAICAQHHVFDYAKSGYLNLFISNKSQHGDNKAMVQARSTFLSNDPYAFLKDALVKTIGNPDTFIDLACGEGYYTKQILGKDKYGVDLSKDALIHASKQDHDTQYILSSIFDLPFEDQSCDCILTCFAPFAKDEIERVLKKDGKFVFVTPGKNHLFEMKQVLYETPYYNETKELDTSLQKIDEQVISQSMTMSHDLLMALFAMTPYAYKTGKRGIEKFAKYDSLDITMEFVIRTYIKTNG